MLSEEVETLGVIEGDVRNHFHPLLHPCAIDAFHFCDMGDNELSGGGMFLCGQYELDENSEGGTSRGGGINICTVNSKTNSLSVTTTDCRSGVLDLKVAVDYAASAQSDSSLCIHRILRDDNNSSSGDVPEPPSFRLDEMVTISEDGEGLFLSVDWNLGYTVHRMDSSSCGTRENFSDLCGFVRRHSVCDNGEINTNIAISTQEGSLIVYELSNERQLCKTFTVNMAHHMFGQPMPAWIVCFDPHTKNTLVSGGDDCLMKLWDLRQGSNPTHTNKIHSAGVTSAQWHPQQENIFATGSYDEYLRVWDYRSLRSPVAEIHTGGGVWRTKWNMINGKSSFLFLSCMQGGSAIVEYNHKNSTCEIKVKHTDKTNSNHLAYGIDIIGARRSRNETENKIENENGNEYQNENTSLKPPYGFANSNFDTIVTIASCSFYDNLVQIWDAAL